MKNKTKNSEKGDIVLDFLQISFNAWLNGRHMNSRVLLYSIYCTIYIVLVKVY